MIDPDNPDYANTPASPRRPLFDYAPAEAGAAPGVSIVTPFFNTGPEFHETARSVLAQSFQQFEWVIVDDGSTDAESLAMLAGYEGSDPRIRVVRPGGNRGPSAARNTGFHEARAPNVVPLDSDDLLEPTAVEKLLWFLESHPEYAFAKGYCVGFGAQQYLWRKGFHDRHLFLRENPVTLTSMIRRDVHERVGGYDESIRAGLEDWEFWLRCANRGFWGGTIPEFLDWYRRRVDHSDRWRTWNGAKGSGNGKNVSALDDFRTALRQRYPELWSNGLPVPEETPRTSSSTLAESIPWPNALGRTRPRLLMIVPWLAMGGADKFNLDVIEELTRKGWEVTVATTIRGGHAWLPEFTARTPDVFVLGHFLHTDDYPRFLRYLIASRGVETVMVTNSECGYRLLAYLRAHAPRVTFVDYCHMEEDHWNVGGYPRMAVDYQPLLDLNIASSEHLKGWMTQRGAAPERVRVCHTNVDTERWRPDPVSRANTRRALGIDDSTPVVLYLGRLCDQKQPRVFARTMRLLTDDGAPFVACVAGDGPDETWLREFVTREGLQTRVRLLGAQSNDRVRRLLTAADVFFLPSQWEGIALSIFEAMACGLAVVGADVGGQRELVTPECGVLLPRADARTEAEAYARVLRELLHDPESRRRMGESGRARVMGHFRLTDMVERLLGLLEEAHELHRREPRSIPAPDIARTTAMHAVQYMRLTDAYVALEHAVRQQLEVGSWRARTYHTMQRLLTPYYRRALERDVRWVVPLKEGLKRQLLRPREPNEPWNPGDDA